MSSAKTQHLSPEATRFLEILLNTIELTGIAQSVLFHNLQRLDDALLAARRECDEARSEIQGMREMQQRINEEREALATRHQNEIGAIRDQMERQWVALTKQVREGEQRLSALRHKYRSGILARETIKRTELERRRLAKENTSLKAQVTLLSSREINLDELRDDLERVHERLGTLLGHDDGGDWTEYED